jgi:hypothetical protein
MFAKMNKLVYVIFIVFVFMAAVLISGCAEQKVINQNAETQHPDIQFVGFDAGYEGKQLIPFAVKVSDNETVTIESSNGTAIVSGVCSDNPNIQFTGFDTEHKGELLIPFAIKVSDNGTVTIKSDNGTVIVSGMCSSK